MVPAERPTSRGRLVIISGPSGVGKSTVLGRLLEECPLPLAVSVSATTRPARPGELDGKAYYFLSPSEFAKRREAGNFLECKEVYGRGYWYGTLHDDVTSGLEEGKWVILEIDVEGAFDVLKQVPEAITIFLHPGSVAELERRLRARATEPENDISRRLREAEREMALSGKYRHCVINDIVKDAARQICEILSHHGD
jgi:guanylate kinase